MTIAVCKVQNFTAHQQNGKCNEPCEQTLTQVDPTHPYAVASLSDQLSALKSDLLTTALNFELSDRKSVYVS